MRKLAGEQPIDQQPPPGPADPGTPGVPASPPADDEVGDDDMGTPAAP